MCSSDLIFIVGLPRAGSTLLEQILASHSQVEGTMEPSDIATAVGELEGHNKDNVHRVYPKVLETLEDADFRRLGEKYLADTRVYRSGKAFFIDKMPNNFRHIGLIHLMLPNAKIIDARREPMACCFSNFKQLFASGQDFTYSIEDIARYYRTYIELMDHWESVLPGRVLRVQHALDHHGQVRPGRDLLDVGPREARIEERRQVEHRDRPGRARGGDRRDGEVAAEGEAGAQLPLAPSRRRQVDGDHDGREPAVGRLVDEDRKSTRLNSSHT